MFEYEIQKQRTAELLRQADHQRLVNEIRRARRDARRAARRSAKDGTEGRVSSLRSRFVRAA
ncbi:hypothetical protein [Streptomyces beijiangensis]|uniref:Uncharacterized protein n=1 Tax=Streptomyces beijiangensis TaxID=163361 RepID=A0A939FC07_9ACTN|nr:hypothetical protein [Streptomyces beijiangensis]MBO0516280.1 hypothetical protein [Streptomyces beijiangensis]